MKRPSMNIVLGTIFGIAVAGASAVALAGRAWLWFGVAVGAAGGFLIAKKQQWNAAWRMRLAREKSRKESN